METEIRQTRRLGHFIAGKWEVSSEEFFVRTAPATGTVVAEIALGTYVDVERAVRAARNSFDLGEWPLLTAIERSTVLHRVADLIAMNLEGLAKLDSEEGGKPIRIARDDVRGSIALTRYAAGLALQMHGTTYTNNGPDYMGLIIRQPAGVVGLITPWNFPLLIMCQKLPFALAAGCTVVVKPSEFTTSSTAELVRLYQEAGLPDGVLNLVTGDGRVGQALAEHKEVDVLSFTGSTSTGRKVIEAAKGNLKKLSLELGGKAANVVFSDCDVNGAVEGSVFGAFFNNGECCVSQSRLLIEDSIADGFIGQLISRTNQLSVGNPLDDDIDIGALIHESHLKSVMSHVNDGQSDGARLISGGKRITHGALSSGLFMLPTILDEVKPESTLFQKEIFGPVLSITRFKTLTEAIELANGVDYGLSNSVWSNDINKVLKFSRAVKSGTVYVNTTIDAPVQMPFGGYKSSGLGREMGEAGFEEFTELKSISIRTNRMPISFPPDIGNL